MNPTVGVELIVAIKRLSTAKTRLAPAFTPVSRAALVQAMLADTLAAALAVPAIAGVTVISPDPAVLAAAHAQGARAMTDPTPPRHPDPLNRAISAAEAALRPRTPNLGVLQGDLPALRSLELASALAAASIHSRSFVSDRHRTGTAALFVFGVALNPCLGDGSARRHSRSGAAELTGRWPGLRCDVDTSADMTAALRLGVGPSTRSALDHLDTRRPRSGHDAPAPMPATT